MQHLRLGHTRLRVPEPFRCLRRSGTASSPSLAPPAKKQRVLLGQGGPHRGATRQCYRRLLRRWDSSVLFDLLRSERDRHRGGARESRAALLGRVRPDLQLLPAVQKIVGRPTWWCWLLLLAIIPFIGAVALFVLWIIVAIDLSKSFGHDIPFALGLIFLSIIFFYILWLDRAPTGVRPLWWQAEVAPSASPASTGASRPTGSLPVWAASCPTGSLPATGNPRLRAAAWIRATSSLRAASRLRATPGLRAAAWIRPVPTWIRSAPRRIPAASVLPAARRLPAASLLPAARGRAPADSSASDRLRAADSVAVGPVRPSALRNPSRRSRRAGA